VQRRRRRQQWINPPVIAVQLEPKHPPRRKSRKVRAFAAEIHRLHAQGYTCNEIRDALAEVGVVVSRSTVQREAARGLQRPAATAAATAATRAHEPLPSPARPQAIPDADDRRTAKQVAEDFMKDQITNPLLRTERKP
jgi:IS30 family transposase